MKESCEHEGSILICSVKRGRHLCLVTFTRSKLSVVSAESPFKSSYEDGTVLFSSTRREQLFCGG